MSKRLKRRHGSLREDVVDLPVDRMLELVWDLGDDFDGTFPVSAEDVSGARVKPVVFCPEEKLELVDKAALRDALLDAGAVYVKAPTVHVVRKKERRDERHDVELELEASLELFAEETRVRDPEGKIAFAAELAREADAGATE